MGTEYGEKTLAHNQAQPETSVIDAKERMQKRGISGGKKRDDGIDDPID